MITYNNQLVESKHLTSMHMNTPNQEEILCKEHVNFPIGAQLTCSCGMIEFEKGSTVSIHVLDT
jgi:hypothetical protein